MADINRSISIIIDGTKAGRGAEQVRTAIAKLEAQLAALTGSEADYATRSKKLRDELEKKTKTLQTCKLFSCSTQSC